MQAERWQEVDALFDAALEQPPDRRTDYLSKVCGGDTELQSEVEGLLLADDRAGTFLEQSLVEPPPVARPTSEEGKRVGGYRLLRTVRHGGMASVYLAVHQDDEYHRPVALKLIRAAELSDELAQRLRAEGKILAGLEHPSIARLYGGGTAEDGRPYLVMEFIEGVPIDTFVQRHQLGESEILEIFKEICEAVEFAHGHRLLHRDIKPDNILVTAEGTPKLLDFGIAKAVGGDAAVRALTGSGVRPMTLRYASPEQVRGEPLAPSTDVYSLGVVLFELLTGRLPYRLTSDLHQELESAVCHQLPWAPSRVIASRRAAAVSTESPGSAAAPSAGDRRAHRDLDNIVLMALRKDPSQRYASPAELAADVTRYLSQRPVEAHPESWRYRIATFLRRNRVAVMVGALMLALACGLLWQAVVQSSRIAGEKAQALQARNLALDLLRSVDPEQADGSGFDVRNLLQLVAERAAEQNDDPELQADFLDAVGKALTGQGAYDEALGPLERALALRRERFGPGDLAVSASQQHVAEVLFAQGRYDRAEQLFRLALTTRRALLGRHDGAVAETLAGLAATLGQKGDLEDAIELHRQALAIRQDRLGARHPSVADSLRQLAVALDIDGDYQEAEALQRQALDIDQEAKARGKAYRVAASRMHLARTLDSLGRLEEAEALLTKALAIQREILEADHPELADTKYSLAAVLRKRGKLDEAAVLLEESLDVHRRKLGDEHPSVTADLNEQAGILMGRRQLVEAEAKMVEVVRIHRKIFFGGHQRLAESLNNLAFIKLLGGEAAGARTLLNESLEMITALRGSDHPHCAEPLSNLGYLARGQQDWIAAEDYFRQALEIRRRGLSPGHFHIAASEAAYADALISLDRHEEARPLIEGSYRFYVEKFGEQDRRTQQVAGIRNRLAPQDRGTEAPDGR